MLESNKSSSTSNEQKPSNLPKDYVRTSDEQKLQLIDLVINEKYSMKLASQIVGVKLSTVKYTIKAYKTDKQFFMEKLKPKKVKIQKEKKKQSPQNASAQNQIPISEFVKTKDKSLNHSNTQKEILEANQSINPLNPMYAQEISQFQNYFQTIQFWNVYWAMSNGWVFSPQEN